MADTVTRQLRWGELVSPRSVYRFFLQDAMDALPTLLGMAGFFLVGLGILLLVKWIFYWLFLHTSLPKQYVRMENGSIKSFPSHPYGSLGHLFIETVFLLGLVVLGFWASRIGGLSLWESAIGASAVGIMGTYIFGIGLQQIGAGWFFYMMNFMEINQYWELTMNRLVGGRVVGATMFYVDLASYDEEAQSVVIHRILMVSLLGQMWTRVFEKERSEEVRVFDHDPRSRPYPTTITTRGGRPKLHNV